MKMEVEFKSDVNTETGSMPYYDMAERYGNEILDAKVGNTDMRVRHIFKKLVEVCVLHLQSSYACDMILIFKCQHVWNINCLCAFLGIKQLHGNIQHWHSLLPELQIASYA